ncbi:MAG: hypothetical protein ACOVOQ_06030 [Flavobacterium sp.]|jgi:hypothetical protein
MRYRVYYELKGTGINWYFDSAHLVVKRLRWLFYHKIDAVVTFENKVVGRVWADNSQRNGMNWYFNNNK